MEVQPVVLAQCPVDHLQIPDLREPNAGVLQRHRNGVVPWRGIGRHVHSDLRRLLERHRVHVARFNCTANRGDRAFVYRLGAHAVQRRIAPQRIGIGNEKRAAAIVEQPLRLQTRLDRAVGDAVGFQVIGLGVVHGNQERRTEGQTARRPKGEQTRTGRQADRPSGRPEKVPPLHVFGIAPFARSSSRLASGTTALDGYVRIKCSRCGMASLLRPWRPSSRAQSSSAAGGAAPPAPSPSPPARTISSNSATAVTSCSPPRWAATCPASSRTSSRPPWTGKRPAARRKPAIAFVESPRASASNAAPNSGLDSCWTRWSSAIIAVRSVAAARSVAYGPARRNDSIASLRSPRYSAIHPRWATAVTLESDQKSTRL